tara:strand:+ start:31 stop:354 length:324 start_codon:yes stop_codon:yes gene_type:complete
MSVEAGGLALLLKYVWLPTIGLLGWFTKGYLNKLEVRQTLSEQKVGELELKLIKDYYDKIEIQQHVVIPLQSSITETREELKAGRALLSEIHSDMRLLKSKILGEDK